MANNVTPAIGNMADNVVIVYSKQTLDQVVSLLDRLEIKGRTVYNAQIIASIVQILETKGTAQTMQNAADTSASVQQEGVNEG